MVVNFSEELIGNKTRYEIHLTTPVIRSVSSPGIGCWSQVVVMVGD